VTCVLLPEALTAVTPELALKRYRVLLVLVTVKV